MTGAPAMVGREAELAELTLALDDVEAGLGRAVFLAGPAGIGKTRLAEELARRAAARGFSVAWGRGWEGGGTPAFFPWAQALRALRRPGLEPPELDRVPVAVERFERFEAVTRYLLDAGRAGPVLLVLEDLHAADRSSLTLLGFVVSQLRGARVLLLGTYRDAELQRLEEAHELSRAGRDGRVLPLSGLEAKEVAALARSFGIEDQAAAARVHAATEGHPFFACEILRGMRARPAEPLRIPESVRTAIRDRLAQVPEEVRTILEAASVLGREIADALVAEASGATIAEVAAALGEAVRAGLLEEEPSGRRRFTHALVRDTLHDGLSEPRRSGLHRSIAEALRRRSPDEADAPLAEIAHHYLEAGRGCLAEAIRFASAAASRSLRQLAFEEAGAIVDRARRAAEAGGAAPADRAELLLVAITARLKLGDEAGGRRASDEAAALARRLREPELLARVALAYGSVLRPARVDPLLVSLLEEALASLPGGAPLRAMVGARLAGALQPAFDPQVPIAMARDAIGAAGGLDPSARLSVWMAAGAALQDVGDPAERRALDAESLRLAMEQGEPALAIQARQRLFFDHLGLGDQAAARRELDTLEALVSPLPARFRWPVALMRGMSALGSARFEEVARHVGEARALIGPAPDPGVERTLRLRAFLEALLAERDDALEDTWRAAAEVFSQHPVPEICQALVHARAGRIDEARAALGSAPLDSIVAFAADPPTSVLLAELVAGLDDAGLARQLEPRVLPSAAHIATWSWLAMTCLGPVSRGLGLLARTAGRWEDADRWFADAEARASKAGLRLLLPRIAFERGEARLRAGDRAGGLALLDRAATGASELGLSHLKARIARAGGLAAPPAAGAAPRVAMRREGELWEVTFGDASCRLRDSRGVQMLALLVESAEREMHVHQLTSTAGEPIDAGDAGEVLDDRARAAYRRRISELRAELDEAEGFQHGARADAARRELEALEAQLAQAVGLGGRARRTGLAAERARINVQRRLADAIRRIDGLAPAISAHLKACLRTGVYCRYSPETPRVG